MNRQEKAELIEGLKEGLNKSQALFIVNYQGLTVNALQELRSGLRANQGWMKIAKVRLAKRAISDMSEDMHNLLPDMKEQLGFVFSEGEPTAIAKTLYDFSKENKELGLVVGHFENQVIDSDKIKYLATLPPKDVLLAQLCNVLNSPIVGLACSLNMMIIKLLVVLKKASEKQS